MDNIALAEHAHAKAKEEEEMMISGTISTVNNGCGLFRMHKKCAYGEVNYFKTQRNDSIILAPKGVLLGKNMYCERSTKDQCNQDSSH